MLKKILSILMLTMIATTTIVRAELWLPDSDDSDEGLLINDPVTDTQVTESPMKTVASKAYVDTKIETKQLKIPAAGQPNVGAGETVMTYTTNGNGEIGERGLYSDISSYDASTDGDKLITASALNATFTNLPTTPTTKLECANSPACTLWTIVDQTALKVSGQNLVDLGAVTDGYYYTPQGVYTAAEAARLTDFIPVKAGKKYSVYTKAINPGTGINVRYNLFDSSETWLSQTVRALTQNEEAVVVITPSVDGYLRVSANYNNPVGTIADWSTLRIVEGDYTLATMPVY